MIASDREFAAVLRDVIGRYFASVDRWESAYRRYYRMPGVAVKPGSDLEAEQRDFEDRRREFEGLLPRARALCFKYGQRDAFTGLLYVTLGRYAPQQRTDSAIGRSERVAAMACLMEIHAASHEPDAQPEPSIAPPPERKTSILERIVGFFY